MLSPETEIALFALQGLLAMPAGSCGTRRPRCSRTATATTTRPKTTSPGQEGKRSERKPDSAHSPLALPLFLLVFFFSLSLSLALLRVVYIAHLEAETSGRPGAAPGALVRALHAATIGHRAGIRVAVGQIVESVPEISKEESHE